ncbi:MAG: Rieske (2Fe-2S) protein [Thermoplasmatota archaeon]
MPLEVGTPPAGRELNRAHSASGAASPKDGWIRVASVEEFREDRRVVETDSTSIIVLRLGGQFSAFENVCPHRGGPVATGPLENDVLTCPDHGWKFNARTGVHVSTPVIRLRRHGVRVRDGVVEVAAVAETEAAPGGAPPAGRDSPEKAPPAETPRRTWRIPFFKS